MRSRHWHILSMMLVLIVLCISCKDDNSETDSSSPAYDPSKPVLVSDFTPDEGGAYQKMVIYGDNFGNDSSLVNVTIGGKKAVLISVKGNSLYCMVPSGAFSGIVTVSVGSGANMKTTTANKIFNYQKKMVVGTLVGYRNEYDNQGWKDGPFEIAAGFRNDGCMSFDPRNPDHLYVIYDGADIQLLDLENREVSTPLSRSRFGGHRLRSLEFTNDGEYMVVSVDTDAGGTGNAPSVYLMKRNADGTFNNQGNAQLVASYKQCNGATLHPSNNNELYFNSYERGQVFRMDLNKYFETINNGGTWSGNLASGNYTELFTIQDTGWEFKIHIHPSGNYAYIVVINQHYILRSDYNWAEKRFAPAYVVAGQVRSPDWVDGAGASARLNRPYQGVFVKNPDYVAEGRADEYDFYFTDCRNHAIRKMTPEGIVSTFAGRGRSGQAADNNVWGTEDGDLREVARFRDPTGIAYDEETNIFYILDTVGRKIRTISMEDEGSEPGEETEEGSNE
ncbi:IPT/TIG domain-containing protein [Proteiniphilum sp.]|uniref:IPT/TIG domain-containing protein n=1 Tax=Proteiniphilum sp. TaxID=1926877 RepID=UPI002B2192B4|nr:IPT/TIG domain-containing protein [Proteiniphilum sp.]MEA4918060.1 IPT/TIG domain-containing protein [Proteiniphilum sp.]